MPASKVIGVRLEPDAAQKWKAHSKARGYPFVSDWLRALAEADIAANPSKASKAKGKR